MENIRRGAGSDASPEELLNILWDFEEKKVPEIRHQLIRGSLTLDNLNTFIEHRNPFEAHPVSLRTARKVLGTENVLNPRQVAEAINPYRAKANLPLLVPPASAPIRYTEQSLREHKALDEREFGKDNGPLLAYSYELSLRELRRIFGTGPNDFYPTTWDQKPKEDSWAEQPGQPGWYLISLQGRFGLTNWADQDTKIAQLGPYERAHEITVTNIAFALFLLQGKRVPDNFWHWGHFLDSDGCRVYVRYVRFYNDGFYVGRCHPRWNDSGDVRVLVARKRDS
ncbi:MAG: hypothetical protein A3I38_03920 [Candidatus Wildermuthbacteria bacterium RIFCSPLOWO2_02_FULL_47_10]|nr:MAG: hypothetical protein A3I38_03920 [Candidatus Wildermuthbacteria bacterium RIFCSPLOWO2_02_FULL_47_10]